MNIYDPAFIAVRVLTRTLDVKDDNCTVFGFDEVGDNDVPSNEEMFTEISMHRGLKRCVFLCNVFFHSL